MTRARRRGPRVERTRRRRSRSAVHRRRAGTVYIETLVIVGMLFIPLFMALDFVRRSAGSELDLSAKVREYALIQASKQCSGTCPVTSQQLTSLPVSNSDPLAHYESTPTDLHFSTCLDTAVVPRDNHPPTVFARMNAYACQDKDPPPNNKDNLACFTCVLATGGTRLWRALKCGSCPSP